MCSRRDRSCRSARLVSPASLPATAHAPVVMPPLSSLSRVMKIGLTSGKLSQVELTTLTKWTVRPRLMAVRGVANVAIWGQRDRQIQVHVDPERLQANNVTLDQVLTASRDATAVAAGGFIDMPNQRMAISHVSPVQQRERSRRDAAASTATARCFASATSRPLPKGRRRRSATP